MPPHDDDGPPARDLLPSILPAGLRDWQLELAGRLSLGEAPGGDIKALRERYGFTQEWLAGHLGMRRESLSRIESGHVQIGVPFVQRFTRIMVLAKCVREHMASVEARRGVPDESFLGRVAASLQIERHVAEDIILASMISYEQKRRQALRDLERRRYQDRDSAPMRL